MNAAADQTTPRSDAGADIAADGHHLRQEFPGPEHRIALLAAEGRHDDGAAFLRIEGGHQPVDHPAADQRHVAEADHHPLDLLGHGGEAGAQAGGKSLGIVLGMGEADRPAGQRLLDPGVLADVTRICADLSISIDAIFQREAGEGEEQVDVVILTHRTVERSIDAAIRRIEALPTIPSPVVRIRLEELL